MEDIASPIPLDELLGHRAWVRALAHSLVRDAATADDVEQDAWVAAIERPPSERSSARAWFATVLRNRVREKGRAAGRATRREAAAARPEHVEGTADVVARGESHKRVVLAVMDLDEPYRTTVLLRFFESLPPREVAVQMSCPVETVRTRTRRALAQLRERLGGDADRDGSAWRGAILPLLAGTTAEATPPTTGDRKMLPIKLATVVALLLAIPVTFALLGPGDGAPRPAPGNDAASTAGGANAPAPRRVRVANLPPVAAPEGAPEDEGGAGNDGSGDRVEVWPPVAPLPEDEDASVFADGKLAMRVSVEPPHPRAEEPFDLVVTFRNDGTGPLRFHVPEFEGLVPFPRLELRGADGKILMPVAGSFQSMWQHGLQGEIVRLEPGEERAVKTMVGGVAEVDPDPARRETGRFAHSQKRLALAPGDYAVTAILVKEKPVVPWGEKNFKEVTKTVPGLWTGDVRSTPITIRVAPPDHPMLILHAPEKLVPGVGLALTLEVSNPSQEDREIRGAFAMRRSQKGGPGHVAWFELGETAVPTAADHTRTLTLAAGETRTCRIDLGALVWERTSNRRDFMGRDPWPFSRSYPALWVTCGERDENGKGMIGSNTAFRGLEAAPDIGGTGLSLRVALDGLSATEPFVSVHLRNGGTTDIALPRRLGAPQHLRLSVDLSALRKRPALLPVVSAGPPEQLAPDDVVVLAPGEEIHERVNIARDWSESLPAGTFGIRAHWTNVDAGDREGFDVRPVVGRLTSKPVDVTIDER